MTESEQGLRAIFLQNYGGCLTTQELRVMSFVISYCDRAVQAARRQERERIIAMLNAKWEEHRLRYKGTPTQRGEYDPRDEGAMDALDRAEQAIEALRDEEASDG